MYNYDTNGKPPYAQAPQYPQYPPQYPPQQPQYQQPQRQPPPPQQPQRQSPQRSVPPPRPPQYPQGGSAWYGSVPMPQTPPQAVRKGGGPGNNGGGPGKKGGNGRPPQRPAKPPKRKRFIWQLLNFLVVLCILGGVAAYGYVYKAQSDVKPYLSVFLDNISIDGIQVGGMTWEEGSSAVWAQANAKKSGWSVRLKYGNQYNDITAETLGIHFDPSQALEDAWRIGHETTNARGQRKTVFELRDEIEAMKASSAEFSSGKTNGDTAPIDTILQRLEQIAYIEPKDAKIVGFDKDNLQSPFSFEQERMGQYLDTTAAKEQILQMVQTYQSGEILLETTPVAPRQTVAELQKTVSLRFKATTPIDRHSTEDRNNNIRVAFGRINGLRIIDGGSFSFNKIVGRRTEKDGFFPAFEYNYGELVTGWGGGVCQASTTVYLAALRSGMSVTSRTAHSTPVSYTALGQDATVSDTRGREKDLVFKNTSGGDIYLTAHVLQDPNNKKLFFCEVRIYGLAMENTRYSLESNTVEVLPKPVEIDYVEDKEGKYTTFVGETKSVISASEGAVVETYLNTYVNDVIVDRKLISKDTYPNRKERVYIGIMPAFY